MLVAMGRNHVLVAGSLLTGHGTKRLGSFIGMFPPTSDHGQRIGRRWQRDHLRR